MHEIIKMTMSAIPAETLEIGLGIGAVATDCWRPAKLRCPN
jgi:hypothetical protein